MEYTLKHEIKIPLTIFIEKSSEDEKFVARCEELDLIAVHNKEEQVKQDIIDIVNAYVEFAIENNNLAYLFPRLK